MAGKITKITRKSTTNCTTKSTTKSGRKGQKISYGNCSEKHQARLDGKNLQCHDDSTKSCAKCTSQYKLKSSAKMKRETQRRVWQITPLNAQRKAPLKGKQKEAKNRKIYHWISHEQCYKMLINKCGKKHIKWKGKKCNLRGEEERRGSCKEMHYKWGWESTMKDLMLVRLGYKKRARRGKSENATKPVTKGVIRFKIENSTNLLAGFLAHCTL